MADQFKVGDVVQLKSGGPRMTVSEVGNEAFTNQFKIWCVWFTKAKDGPKQETGNFSPEMLELVR
jgi:uncharacterized protein YodC (DUF2158 family)